MPPAGPGGIKAVPCVNTTQNSRVSVAPGSAQVQLLAAFSFVVVAAAASSSCAPAATETTPIAGMPAALRSAVCRRWQPLAATAKAPKDAPITETPSGSDAPAWLIRLP